MIEVEETKRRITSPESAMITSIVGLSPDPFGTFSVVIKDMRSVSGGNDHSTNQLSGRPPCLQGLCRRQPTTKS